MKKLLIGAAALLATLSGALAGAPAQAEGWHGGGYGHHEGYDRHEGYGHRGWGDHDGYRYGYGRGYGYGYRYPGYIGAGDYFGPPPAYYAGPTYYGFYGGCHREFVWTGFGYRVVRACY